MRFLKHVIFGLCASAALSAPGLAQEVNVYSSRHYDSDDALYEAFTKETGITVNRIEGIINSMTPLERRKPDILKASRKRRIAAGAGVQVQEVNKLLKQFEQAQKMMKMMGGKGGMPPGFGL